MSDTRMTVKELKEILYDLPDDAILVSKYEGRFYPYYRCYLLLTNTHRFKIIDDLNSMIGHKVTTSDSFVILK